MAVTVGRSVRPLAVGAILTAGVLGCSRPTPPGPPSPTTTVPAAAPTTTTSPPSGGPATVTAPPPNALFDYQIGGNHPPPAGARVVTRAHETKAPVPGLYNVCYINGFQAQSADESWWLGTHRDLVLQSGGRPVKDTEWNELLLDTSTAAKRAGLAEVVGGWMTGCRDAGFQAVEIDNLDSYGRSGGRLTEDEGVAYLRLLADRAHRLGLAVGQKNAPELAGRRSALGTDFAVAEDCNRYDECDAFTRSYGDHVLVVEYQRSAFVKGCAQWPQLSIVLRDEAVSSTTKAGDMC
jgi:hypothetical protein